VGSLRLRGGLPPWAFPHATSLRWVRYLCPVLQRLLFSAYEDHLAAAIGACGRALDALAPLYAAASDPLLASPANLVAPPPPLPLAGDEDSGGGGGGGGEEGAARAQRHLFAHAAAAGAVQATKLTQPLAAALSVAASTLRAGGGDGETFRSALRAQRRLLRMHEGVAHLVRASGEDE
jgi:hypothetical protein